MVLLHSSCETSCRFMADRPSNVGALCQSVKLSVCVDELAGYDEVLDVMMVASIGSCGSHCWCEGADGREDQERACQPTHRGLELLPTDENLTGETHGRAVLPRCLSRLVQPVGLTHSQLLQCRRGHEILASGSDDLGAVCCKMRNITLKGRSTRTHPVWLTFCA